MSESKKS